MMNQCAESGKILKMGDETSVDRISSLPDELLIQILSSLSTLTAVQTSVLSTRWRHLFTLTSDLSFDCEEYFGRYIRSGRELDEVVKSNFEGFIYGVLASHKKSTVDKFSLGLGRNPSDHDCLHIHEWINAAILRKVRHLHLGIITTHSNFVPDFAFNAHTLEVLEIISYCEYLDVPQLVCLPNLATLELYSLTFWDGDSFKRFLDGCPQLKELTIRCSRWGTGRSPVYISAKRLENLSISWCGGYILIDAPNLVNFTFECQDDSIEQDVITSLENPFCLNSVKLIFASSKMKKIPQIMHHIITGALKVKELFLDDKSVELFTRATKNQQPYSMLKSLQFDTFTDKMWKYATVLLANSPQLETIIFTGGFIRNQVKELPPNLDMELAPFSSNAKTVEVHYFGGSKLELLLLKHLLKNTPALEKLIIYKLKTISIEEELEIRKELLMLPKASIDCTIVFRIGN